MLMASFYSMHQTSLYRVPQLFSGQPDISNLGLNRFAAEFEEFPRNAGPVGTPMEMPFDESLQTIFKTGSTITSKVVLSSTEYRDTALQYSNRILLVFNPATDAVTWEKASYITDLSGRTSTAFPLQLNF